MSTRVFTVLALCLLAGSAAGCGSDDERGAPIPGDSASALENQLAGIQNRLEVPGACKDITGGEDPNTRVVDQILADLPSDVDREVVQGLRDGFDRLFGLVEERCAEERERNETETEAEPPETIEPAPAEPVETETETETEETVPTETEPSEDDKQPPGQDGEPPGKDDDPGQGDGGGTFLPEDGE
jgi:hypothetical protein